MKTFEGKCGIKTTVVCDSVNAKGTRLTTFELEYPRIIHSEFMTHRMISRNAASSRAIPVAKMMEQLTAQPVRFGANISGMQDGGEHTGPVLRPFYDDFGKPTSYTADEAWFAAKEEATGWSAAFAEAGYHKQVFNRLTEPFQMIKVVATATEWDNFFWLRNDSAADPTLQELARLMQEAKDDSTPRLLEPGWYHLPYVEWEVDATGTRQLFYEGDVYESPQIFSLEDAIKVSCARCAAVSFRNVDYNLEKSKEVYDRLAGSDRKHASAFEHCGTPMEDGNFYEEVNILTLPDTWQPGITHMDRDMNLWSGNFKGFVQYRKLIPGENYTK